VEKKKTQRIQLLIRNEMFNKELNAIMKRIGRKYFPLAKKLDKIGNRHDPSRQVLRFFKVNKYPELVKEAKDYCNKCNDLRKKALKPLRNSNDLYELQSVFERFRDSWFEFCDRWCIGEGWECNLSNLWKFIREPVEIHLDQDPRKGRDSISITITKWATLEDIRKKWKDVERLQKYYLSKIEGKGNFERDLRWYDVEKKGFSIKKIAEIEKRFHMRDIDILITRRIKDTIKKEDLQGKVLDDHQLHEEIVNGFLSDKYKADFTEAKQHYLTGKQEGRKGKLISTGISPLQDVIKKAIKRMSEQIAQLNMPPPDKGVLFGLPPLKIG